MMNGTWQSLCLDRVNSNVYSHFYQNIPKVQEIGPVSLFSKFEHRQILDRCQMTLDNLLGVIMNGILQSVCLDHVKSNVYAKCYQNIPKKFKRYRARFTFFSI